jgi:hypothetical protein
LVVDALAAVAPATPAVANTPVPARSLRL